MHSHDAHPKNHRSALDLLPSDLRPYVVAFSAVAMAFALFGFLAGIRESEQAQRPRIASPVVAEDAQPARTYAELSEAKMGPNANWKNSLSQISRPGVFEKVVRTEEMKLAALADRAANRAYDGAPPTIPHPVESQSSKWCLACHEGGLKVGERVASRISHRHFANCTQCHVQQSMVLAHDDTLLENAFSGVKRSGPGERANLGAPPTMPHHSFMRENCMSCHGLVTRPGLRTTHPWFANCTQCHAPSASLDQVHFGDSQ